MSHEQAPRRDAGSPVVGPHHRLRIGRMGEIWTRACLEDRGFAFVKANLRVGRDEIDLLFKSRSEWLLVEVKTRVRPPPSRPRAVVGRRQRKALARAMKTVRARWGPPRSWRLLLAYVTLGRLSDLPSIHYFTLQEGLES